MTSIEHNCHKEICEGDHIIIRCPGAQYITYTLHEKLEDEKIQKGQLILIGQSTRLNPDRLVIKLQRHGMHLAYKDYYWQIKTDKFGQKGTIGILPDI